MHDGQLAVSPGMVRELVDGQFPDWRSHDQWMPAGDVMSHRDLIPGNVLVSGGRLTGILDAGDLGPADPALELVAGWHLLEDGPRQALRADLRCDDLERERGQAWAFQQAMGLVWYYADSNPAMSRTGRRTLARILASAQPARP